MDLDRRSVLRGVAVVGAFLAVDFGAVAYAHKWIGPARLTRETFMEGFRTVFGLHPGFRRNHAKGVAVAGYFDSSGNGRELCKTAVFSPVRTPVIGRFSLTGGNPHVADAPGTARSLALAFTLRDGTQWRTAMLNVPVFPDNSPQGFYDRLLASKVDPTTGQPDPAVMSAFLKAHPETHRTPKLPDTVGRAERRLVVGSELTLYTLMLAQPSSDGRWCRPPDSRSSSSGHCGCHA